MKGWLIYQREDLLKNSFFVNRLCAEGLERGLVLDVMVQEDLLLGIWDRQLGVFYKGKAVEPPCFVINRTRNSYLAKQLTYMGVRVFNSYEVTALCNHKARTYQWASKLHIPMVNTLWWDKRYMQLAAIPLDYPLVLKSLGGHGGEEVFLAHNREEAAICMEKIAGNQLVIQACAKEVGEDVRVFAIGQNIIGAIRRTSKDDFRSNFSLGGTAASYALTAPQQAMVQKILAHLQSDFVGIDFLLGSKGVFLFNEIEDVVGSRTLYQETDVDTAACYMTHIQAVLQHI